MIMPTCISNIGHENHFDIVLHGVFGSRSCYSISDLLMLIL